MGTCSSDSSSSVTLESIVMLVISVAWLDCCLISVNGMMRPLFDSGSGKCFWIKGLFSSVPW